MFTTSILDNSTGTPKFGSMSILHMYMILWYLGHIFPTTYEGYSNLEDVTSLLCVSFFLYRILLPTTIQEKARDTLHCNYLAFSWWGIQVSTVLLHCSPAPWQAEIRGID